MQEAYYIQMKIHRFIGDFNLSKEEVEITNPENIKQIKDILRLKKGEKIILSDGKGTEAEITLDLMSKNKITGIVGKLTRPVDATGSGEAKKVNLYLAILKKENFELAVQKAVEVGVSSVVPVITERTIKTGLNIERLKKIITEASEQSGRSVVPTLSPILDFKSAILEAQKSDERIIFHFVDQTYKPDKNAKSISIFVGPEGGFTEKEIKLAKDSHFSLASLGEFTLRGETAAIVGTYRAVNGI